jgi:hypothetical protein
LSIPPGASRLVVMIEAADPDIASLIRATLAPSSRAAIWLGAAEFGNRGYNKDVPRTVTKMYYEL